jgi:23S rRNA (cytosine1962-C5)-methyltransferase
MKSLTLKKNEDRRLRAGHLWIYSNEIDTAKTPLKGLIPGEEVKIFASDKTPLGMAYVNPHSLISARLFTRDVNERLDFAFLEKRIRSANDFRSAHFSKPYYRLIFGEGDGLPGLVVDRFNDVLSVQINTAGMDAKTNDIISALITVLPQTTAILLRNDTSAREQEGLARSITPAFGHPPETVLVEENETLFHIPLWKGQKTGWFYDHRLNRLRLKDYVANKRVLDVFSYLGAWGLQAARFGAKEVTCVDSSALATLGIENNAALNNLTNNVRIVTEDALTALKQLADAKETFEVIILDPPAFVKKLKDKKAGLIAYQRINEAALKILTRDGILFSCSCSMHVNPDDFMQILRRASLHAKIPLQLLEQGTQSPDHPVHLAIPETSYLKMMILRRP